MLFVTLVKKAARKKQILAVKKILEKEGIETKEEKDVLKVPMKVIRMSRAANFELFMHDYMVQSTTEDLSVTEKDKGFIEFKTNDGELVIVPITKA